MAGRKRMDAGPRNTHVIQMCVTEDEYMAFHRMARETESKSASVWLRNHLRDMGYFQCLE